MKLCSHYDLCVVASHNSFFSSHSFLMTCVDKMWVIIIHPNSPNHVVVKFSTAHFTTLDSDCVTHFWANIWSIVCDRTWFEIIVAPCCFWSHSFVCVIRSYCNQCLEVCIEFQTRFNWKHHIVSISRGYISNSKWVKQVRKMETWKKSYKFMEIVLEFDSTRAS